MPDPNRATCRCGEPLVRIVDGLRRTVGWAHDGGMRPLRWACSTTPSQTDQAPEEAP